MKQFAQKATVHIIGGGFAGLAAALELTEKGVPVQLYEASAQAGGRCRSYYDRRLQREIDNGNHLIVRANREMCRLIERLGVRQHFYPLRRRYHFVDNESGERWSIAPPGLPKGLRPGDGLRFLQLMTADRTQKVAEIFPPSTPLFRSFIEPLCTATLNTRPEQASAALFRKVLWGMMWPGNAAYHQVKTGFGPALVEPMLQRVVDRGGQIHYQKRVQALQCNGDRVAQIHFSTEVVELNPQDRVILATPVEITARLLQQEAAITYHTIINGHFSVDVPAGIPSLLGVVGSPLQWLMVKPGMLSTTTSHAEASTLAGKSADAMAQYLWQEVCKALQWERKPLPPHRILQEKRATFAATPENLADLPRNMPLYENLQLAGDWLEESLPATLEAAFVSGRKAAQRSLP